MNSSKFAKALAICVVPIAASTAEAATLGLPIIKTAPTSVSVVNEFADGYPYGSYTISFKTTIAKAKGAPELVGKELWFSVYFDIDINAPNFSYILIDSESVLDSLDAGVNPQSYLDYTYYMGFPVDTVTQNGPNLQVTFSPPFQGFGPSPDFAVPMMMSLDKPLPYKQGYEYCFVASPDVCQFSETPGLTEIGGEAVTGTPWNYIEGRIDDAVATFSTVGGPPAPVPVPAAGAMMVLGLGLLAGVTRRRKAV